MRSVRWTWGGVAIIVALAVACGRGDQGGVNPPDSDKGDSRHSDGGSDDAGADAGGNDAGTDAGTGTDGGGNPDGGNADGGSDGGTDAGLPPPPPLPVPTLQGWQFYNDKQGLPTDGIQGVTADEGGNVWVAAGRNGVYVQRGGSGSFQKFGLAEGLHPYGYMPDGGPADANPYLNAITIAGGAAGTAYVGYQGREYPWDDLPTGAIGCEGNWDGPNPDPAVYKSGDADKVTLKGDGISVVHYDIFTGPNLITREMRGREKLCSVKRIAYDGATNSVWFGANHGFSRGDANYAGNPACDGQYGCSGVLEHAHPAVNGLTSAGGCCVLLTADYNGIAVDPTSHDVWFGGMIRTTKFMFGSTGGYWSAHPYSDVGAPAWNKIDIWPDAVPDAASIAQRVDDMVTAAASGWDGSVWITSLMRGLAHIDKNNVVDLRIEIDGGGPDKPTNKHMTAVAFDRTDGSLWIGYNREGGGLSRMRNGTFVHFNWGILGNDLANSAVRDIQVQYLPHGKRRILVAFERGVIGAYSGD